MLRRENMRTLTQLKTRVGRIEWLAGVGPKTARAIKRELARLTALKKLP
jgi:hypothetical protein